MFKKMLPWVIMIFVVITLIVFAAFLLWNYLFKDSAGDPSNQARQSVEQVEGVKLTAAETKKLSVDMDDILTNLPSGEFIKISFTFELSTESAKEEFVLLDFKIKAIITQTLSDLTVEQAQGSTGLDYISSTLLNKINQVLDKGKVRQVNITNKVLS
ncbi:MAG: flagellar basal body-associated FliL family protein [Paenibacillaceae bacterium]